MRIASLGSGSKGNATLIQHKQTTVLVDCGFSVKELKKRAAEIQFDLQDIDALLITHEHNDHCCGALRVARALQIPVFATAGTARKISELENFPTFRMIHANQPLQIDDLWINPITVPHDANEPVQFIFKNSDHTISLGVLTDSGHISNHIISSYQHLDGLLVEFNYDPDMLQNGPYPYSLKQRVGGDYGHLSNQQSIDFLNKIDTSRLRTIIVGHISENNNEPSLIEALFQQNPHLPSPILAQQNMGFDWQEIDHHAPRS